MTNLVPKVSVVMSVYNSADYLRESVESIINQTFTDFEFIIIDDGSTDNSWEILSKYASYQRMRLFKNQENIGLTKSLNKGLALAQGEYVARQDADDVSLPKRFEKQVALLDQYPEVVLVSCNIELINSEGYPIGKLERSCDRDLISWYLLFYNHLGGHSQVIFKREIVNNLGDYAENRRYSQDYELWSRLVKVGKIAILSEVLLQQRIHNKSISAEKKLEQKAYSLNQSRYNIKQLIGEQISIEEVEELRKFWVGHWSKNFPDSQKIISLNSRLKRIYQAFIQQATYQKLSKPESEQLRILIGQQFIYWVSFLRMRYNLFAKLKISVYAFGWFPTGVIKYWLNKF